jgi:fructose-1,6-bisphosphatase/inositol monophosphatase family enzyme
MRQASMEIKTIRNLISVVRTAGRMAFKAQFTDEIERDLKSDGSIVTSADKNVEFFLIEQIRQKYSYANVISEESAYPFNPELQYTFVLDPIDGTDPYSQGMPEWSISIGLLDQDYTPIAGIIYSHSLNLLFFADIQQPATINGASINPLDFSETITPNTSIMVPSSIHKQIDLFNYPGKIRSIGSAALHLCFPLIYPGIFAAIETRGTHIWDIAGAHAINRSLGLELEYMDGRKINYQDLLDGRTAGETILAGTPDRIVTLKKFISKI